MRFVGVDIAAERHVFAILAEDGAVLARPTPFGEDAEGFDLGGCTAVSGIQNFFCSDSVAAGLRARAGRRATRAPFGEGAHIAGDL